MRHGTWALWFGLSYCTLLNAGPIRVTKQMGPMARRAVRKIRTQREARDTARQEAQLAKRIAIAEIKSREKDLNLEMRLARTFEKALRARKFLVRPYRNVHKALQDTGEEMLASSITLRQLCRRLRVGRLIRLEILELRVTDHHHAGYAHPSWWGKQEKNQRFAEVHLRMKVFDSKSGEVTFDRQDRQHVGVGPPDSEGNPGEDQALGEAVRACITHLLDALGPAELPLHPHPLPHNSAASPQATDKKKKL